MSGDLVRATAVSAPARVRIEPIEALVDEPVDLTINGLAPGAEVAVRAVMTDEIGRRWSSDATFRTDAAGGVDLSRQAPTRGTYASADAMGMVWSMRLIDDQRPGPFRKWSASPMEIDLTVETEGCALWSERLRRLFVSPGVIERRIREDGFVATYFAPRGPGPFPAALVLGGSNRAYLESMSALLASRGIAALAFAYFGREELPPALVEIPLERFERGIAWLREQPAVGRIGIVGISKGAEAALLLATRDPAIGAVVSYGGTAYVFRGIPLDPSAPPTSSWTAAGRPLPFIDVPRLSMRAQPGGAPGTTTPSYHAAVDRAAADIVRAATIPVERVRGGVLLVSGQDDGVWPSHRFGDTVMERLARHAHPYPYRHIVYGDAGHTLTFRYVPTTAILTSRGDAPYTTGGTPEGNARALADSWPQVVTFLKDTLQGPPVVGD